MGRCSAELSMTATPTAGLQWLLRLFTYHEVWNSLGVSVWPDLNLACDTQNCDPLLQFTRDPRCPWRSRVHDMCRHFLICLIHLMTPPLERWQWMFTHYITFWTSMRRAPEKDSLYLQNVLLRGHNMMTLLCFNKSHSIFSCHFLFHLWWNTSIVKWRKRKIWSEGTFGLQSNYHTWKTNSVVVVCYLGLFYLL